MRTHSQIIKDAGGPAAVAKIVGASPNTAKQWRTNDSIPGKHWRALVMAGTASWDELGLAAAEKAGVSADPMRGVAV